MVAIRWRNSETEQPPSLYVSTTAGVILNSKYTAPEDQQKGNVAHAVKGTAKEDLKQPKQAEEGQSESLLLMRERYL